LLLLENEFFVSHSIFSDLLSFEKPEIGIFMKKIYFKDTILF
jgi:hypothetical protein